MSNTYELLYELLNIMPKFGLKRIYYPRLSLALGSVEAAMIIHYCVVWRVPSQDDDGWMYINWITLEKETGLCSHRHNEAVNVLIYKGVLESRLEEIDGGDRVVYRFNMAKLKERVMAWMDQEDL